MTESDHLTPSLLEPQSRGGDIAEGGFSFQDHIILARIPLWLAQDGFTAMLREGIGDVEAKFFVPEQGFVTELLEVKVHTLQPSHFWKEIKRFKEIDSGSPNTYRVFILVATGISRDLEPLVNGLRRVRNPNDFYEQNSLVYVNSLKDYIQLVKKSGGTEEDAKFLLNKVEIEVDWITAKLQGEALFKQSFTDYLQEYNDLSIKTLDNIYNNLGIFLRQKRNESITRKDLENKLREKIPSNQLPDLRSILIYTATDNADNPTHPGLRFDWADFSGGETRAIAQTEAWNGLVINLQKTRNWIENHRNTKRIKLLGDRRLPTCLALGSVFSAVRGYAIEMEYRSQIWATDSHATSETPAYPCQNQTVGDTGDRLIVTISILRDIRPDVEKNLAKYELEGMPQLHIYGKHPIISPEQTNDAVRRIKDLIVGNLRRTGSKEIHLFFAGLAPLAMFLGHRLDGTASVVCYGWIGNEQYTRTCHLFSGLN
jgi:hypothetical protein